MPPVILFTIAVSGATATRHSSQSARALVRLLLELLELTDGLSLCEI
jgi:hypothetical protein